MRRVHLALLALGLVTTGLAGCGKFGKPQRAAWRDQAEAACMASREVPLSAYVSLRGQPIEGPGTCGMEKPLKVAAFAGGRIALTSTATLGCPVVATTDRWLAEIVQPAAMNGLGAQVIELRAGSYSCRAVNNGSGSSRTSEHAYGNAVDVFAFRLNDGRVVTVKDGWRGAPEEQAFLREVFVGACGLFSTVLGPGADAFHYDHFHIDLARHNGGRRICKPVIKFTPNYDLPPPDPARNTMAQQAPGRAGGAIGLAAAGVPGGSRPPGGVAGGYPLAHQGGQPLGPARYQTPPPAATPRPLRPEPLPSEQRGPLQLPGSVPPTEEVILGDEDGEGVLDEPASGQPPITPRTDPFAHRGPQHTGTLRKR